MKYLGIDYGLHHLGLAVSFDSLAEPRGHLDYRQEEAALIALTDLCRKEGIEGIIIGISEGKMAQRTRGFAKRLSQSSGLPVEFEDETLTSQEAEQRLIETGRGQKKRRQKDHQVAAALILQAFLDRQ